MTSESIKAPYRDCSLPNDVRAIDLISRMTLEEKVSQMVHGAPAIERLGVPEYNWWNECLHGVARAGRATVFPQAIGLAATFDEDLMYRVSTAISDEARAMHHAVAAMFANPDAGKTLETVLFEVLKQVSSVAGCPVAFT